MGEVHAGSTPNAPRLYDTHVHVWTLDPDNYPWHSILRQAPIPDYPFTGVQLRKEMDSAGVERAVLVQPSTYGWDHSYLMSVLADDPHRLCGVALVDPADAAIQQRVSELARAPGMRGLRFHLLEDSQEKQFGRAWRGVVNAVRDSGLVITFQAAPRRLSLVTAIARECHDIPIVIDHLGLIRWTGADSAGLDDLRALSKFTNVYVKLSGLDEICDCAAPFECARPLVAAVVEVFGPDRMMWGSNGPHALAAGSYRALTRVVEVCLPDLSRRDLERIRWQTAAQVWW